MSKRTRSQKSNSNKNAKVATEDVCLCCSFQESIQEALTPCAGRPQPIPTPWLFYFALGWDAELSYLIDRFDEALSILERDGIIVNNDGMIELANRPHRKSQPKPN